MTNPNAIQKRCPKCSEKDYTDFATCRNCGTSYDAKTPKKHHISIIGLYLILAAAPVFLLPGFLPRPPQSDPTKWHTDMLTGKQYYVDLAAGRGSGLARDVELAEDLSTNSTHTYWGWLAAQPGGSTIMTVLAGFEILLLVVFATWMMMSLKNM